MPNNKELSPKRAWKGMADKVKSAFKPTGNTNNDLFSPSKIAQVVWLLVCSPLRVFEQWLLLSTQTLLAYLFATFQIRY